MIMIDWVSIVRHSRRRFSNYVGGGRPNFSGARSRYDTKFLLETERKSFFYNTEISIDKGFESLKFEINLPQNP